MKASARRRILMLVENGPYPQDTRVCQEARTLVEGGYQVAVIAPMKRGQRWRERVDDVRVYRYPAPPPGNGLLGYVWEYGYSMVATFVLSTLVLVRDGFDVVHAHNPPDTFFLIALCYKPLRKFFVFDHHDLSPEMYWARFPDKGNRMVQRVLGFLEKLTFRSANHVISTNESYKAIAISRGGVPERCVTVVRNGPDLDRIRPRTPDPVLRQRAKTIIGYVGAMGVQDGIDYFIRALAHLVTELGRTDVYAVLIGTGEARDNLIALAADLKVDRHILFTGYVSDEDLFRYLSTADLCVDPDPANPFADRSTMIKMMEYMALEKPIVAFDLTEHRATAAGAALYARPNDEADMARQIAVLMDDPKLRQELGRIGKERIDKELAWQHQKPRLIRAYDTLFGEGKQHP